MNLARQEREFLICEALGINKTDLISHPELMRSDNPRLAEYISRQEKNEPLAYITGYQPFMGLKFFVDRNVLIPRPETELLVEETSHLASLITHPDILDIGTGSGAIAVSLSKLIPNAKITAVDITQEALSVAKKNAEFHDVSGKIEFMQSNLFDSLKDKKFDIIVSNPPYIPSAEIEGLEPNVKDHEPRLALDGGDDGLDIIRKIISGSKKHLNDTGVLAFEFGFGQAEMIGLLLKEAGFPNFKIYSDYAGIQRFAAAYRQR